MRAMISEAARNYILGRFLTDSNSSIMAATGCSLPTIYRVAKAAGLERTQEYRDNACGRIVLTERQEAWLRQHFANTDNWELADHLGISESSLHRLARRFHLVKSAAYMRRCQAEANAAARYFNVKNGTYPQKGVYNENLQKGRSCCFKSGLNNLERNGAANERRRLARSLQSRMRTIEEERRRIRQGLPQRTRLRLKVEG